MERLFSPGNSSALKLLQIFTIWCKYIQNFTDQVGFHVCETEQEYEQQAGRPHAQPHQQHVPVDLQTSPICSDPIDYFYCPHRDYFPAFIAK